MGIGAWKRARSPEQKAERERAILDAAAGLFLEKGFEAASMRAIACRACLSKGNLYRYFKTKEELFLKLYLEDFTAWADELEQTIAGPDGQVGPPWLARIMASSLVGRPRMGGLTALLTGVLERNAPVDALLAFKLKIVERALHLAEAVHGAVPALSAEQAMRFLHMVHLYAAGLWPAAHPSPELERVMAGDELLSQFMIDFERDLALGIQTILAGILEQARHFPPEEEQP